MNTTEKLIDKLTSIHRAAVWLAQTGIIALSGVVAFLLRFDLTIPAAYLDHLAWAIPIWVIMKSTVFRFANLDRGWWRYVSVIDLMRIAAGNLGGSVLSCLLIAILAPSGFPRSIYLLDLMICFLGTAGVRIIVRLAAEAASHERRGDEYKETLIYGGGGGGVTLLREIQMNPKLLYRVKGFLDDRPDKHGVHILGVPVLGGGDKIAALVQKHKIQAVLIAMPSATGAEMTRILTLCHKAGVECMTVPGLGEVMEGRGLAGQIREVAVEDLLGRNAVYLESNMIRSALEGKLVMVTGAAGSIGSELCRQIARFQPAGIVGFEIAESPLFEIDREMRERFPNTPFYPEIGSIQNRNRLDEVLRQYSPSVVYHAAAYKHVPLMETHVFEAIENNIFGTYNVAVAAAAAGVEEFVMISSDKAVRPTNIMGATKRVAELLILDLQKSGCGSKPTTRGAASRSSFFGTKYVAVRFGNVLGSNGSVIPIFKKQIAAGGPVTVTHPEMRRFFMTIPEACQLVLQAAAIGAGGQICVLDMGEAVKIVDLARNLILLSGLKPNVDIKIEFHGIRPGEKLYEEVTTMEEETVPTAHEKIRVFVGNALEDGEMTEWLVRLREICRTRDVGQLVVTLKEIVVDYSPGTHLLKRVIRPQQSPASAASAR